MTVTTTTIRTAIATLAVLGLACEGPDQRATPQAGPPPVQAAPPMLPKYRLPGEYKTPGKSDQFDDFRLANPQWYAITQPPSVAEFRAHKQWEPSQVFLVPYNTSVPQSIRNTMVDIIVGVLPVIDVLVAVPNTSTETALINALKAKGVAQGLIDEKLHPFVIKLDSIWLIDWGPIPLVNGTDGSIAFADFRYYQPRVNDDAFPTKLGWMFGTETYRAPMDWEGGNFQGDGEGTCYTSQGTLWENPGYTWDDIQKTLRDYLACQQLVVLKPLSGEGTTHIDMFLKIGARDLAVIGMYRASQDTTNAKVTADNKAILEGVRLLDGTPMRVFTIPMPDNTGVGEKVWRTYANSAFANGVNLVPVYSINKDLETQAMAGWAQAMPEYDHIPILSDEIITWGGAVDCITRQIPVGEFKPWHAPGTCQDGTCTGGGAGAFTGECGSDDECVGPEWVCACNDCSGACGGTTNECGGITFEGCCEPDGTLKYCEGGLQQIQCGSWDQCGWNPTGAFYDCGFGAEGPAGFPKACPGEVVGDDATPPDQAKPDEAGVPDQGEDGDTAAHPDEPQSGDEAGEPSGGDSAGPDAAVGAETASSGDARPVEDDGVAGGGETTAPQPDMAVALDQGGAAGNDIATSPDAGQTQKASGSGGGCVAGAGAGPSFPPAPFLILGMLGAAWAWKRRMVG